MQSRAWRLLASPPLAALLLLLLLLPRKSQGAPAMPWAETPEAEGFDSDILQGIQPAVQRLVDDHTVPGAVVMGARHGRLVLNVTAGGGAYASEAEPPIHRLFSMSKPVIAVLALALVHAGRLALDDPIDQYLPELAAPRVYVGEDAARHGLFCAPGEGAPTAARRRQAQ